MKIILSTFLLFSALGRVTAAPTNTVEQWDVFETSFETAKHYTNAFLEVEVDVVFRHENAQWKVPAFWAGDGRWTVRFAPPSAGKYQYHVECTDRANPDLNGKEEVLHVPRYTGNNPLRQQGFIQVSANGRHFQHADGTPFFWLADTWWKNLCKRMTWEGFQELTADRKAKGFTVVQIVCGPYPDEGFLEPSLANEGGLPYESIAFARVNPKYFDYADRRLKHLIDSGIAPAIVGAWGRGDCNSMQAIGAAGLKRHWRYLVARYSAYPVFWILAGEIPEETKWGQGPWAEVATYLRGLDPYHRLLTCHTGHGRRGAPGDVPVIDFDMVGGSHDERAAVDAKTVAIVSSAYAKTPAMPVLVGETCYEGHMQQGFGDVQRRMFWGSILSGAAGHTYGAAGVWHASVEGDPGCASSAFGGSKVYDWTLWKEGMNYPGAVQLGIGKKLLEQYPWARFGPHPEWAEGNSFAAGIPGEVRFVYQPRRAIYDWKGPIVKNLEKGVRYSAFYFDPATGRRYDAGTFLYEGPLPSVDSKPLAAGAAELLGEFKAPPLPSPQDWVLVMEREKNWPPTRGAVIRGKSEAALTINGRSCELYSHGVKPEWGYPAPQRDVFVVVHPKRERKKAPLYVVLHSAGHDVVACVNCTRDLGNHDLYRAPDDFYGLYLDCRGGAADNWWGGMHLNDPSLIRRNSGGSETPVEKRVMETIRWAISHYDIDPDRVYLSGISMGGSGTLGIGMRHGDVFAAIKASIPAGIEHVSDRMYFPPRSIPDTVYISDPPIVLVESAQNDAWSVGQDRFVAAMNERHYPLHFYWGAFGHADNHLRIEKVNDLTRSFDWLSVTRNSAYPVFSNTTDHRAIPWPDDLKSTASGHINAFFRWRCLNDTKDKLEMNLFLASAAELKTTFDVPKESTADVSLRRIQSGRVAPVKGFRWTFGSAQGEGHADATGVITIPSLRITAEPTTLTVMK